MNIRLHQRTRRLVGFSLIEVVMALAIFAIAVPTIIGVFSLMSKASRSATDRGEGASVVSAVQLYLNGQTADAQGTNVTVSFSTVYGWVQQASTNPASAQVLYAYQQFNDVSDHSDGTEFSISQTAPSLSGPQLNGKIMAIQILTPSDTLLPSTALTGTATDFDRAYLPLQISLYALSDPQEPLSMSNFVDSYPMVITR